MPKRTVMILPPLFVQVRAATEFWSQRGATCSWLSVSQRPAHTGNAKIPR